MVPHSLTDKQRRRLEALQLHLNEPEPVLICRPCGYALKPFGERVSRHLAEKHEVPKPQRRGLSALVKSLHLGDPNDVALRPDGLPPHETLTVTRGHACRHCSYRTASDDLTLRPLWLEVKAVVPTTRIESGARETGVKAVVYSSEEAVEIYSSKMHKSRMQLKPRTGP
ncbi:hypothetical protein CCHR01_18928 [Colletotrichum chrysophilum]|uniref:Uncharacterized protein n=1 Tax=Colletotrichum chrysophilum TaxID=1836956 RepID=A0AAD8ZZQ9_9PEZI|nr:hypothetical protein CCHR01_18928 [Colletotrichum chrysophilum]